MSVPPPPPFVRTSWQRLNFVAPAPKDSLPKDRKDAPASTKIVANATTSDDVAVPAPFVANASRYLDLFASEPRDRGDGRKRSPSSEVPGRRDLPSPRDLPVATMPSGPTRVLEYLFLGGVADAQDHEFLRSNGIQLVVNLSMESYWLQDPNVRVVKLDVADRSDADIIAVARKALPLLATAKDRFVKMREAALKQQLGVTVGARQPSINPTGDSSGTDNELAHPAAASEGHEATAPAVLVHCQKGVSRSCAVVTAYLMAQNGWSVVEALEYVQKRRPQAQPNIGFMAQLQDFYDSLTGRSKYDRAALKQGLVLLLRNVEQRTDAELSAALTPYGEIFRIERYDGGKLSMVCFGSRHARRWAEAAIVADSELRGKISNSPEAPAQLVRVPRTTSTRSTTQA
jgi:predicted protein tyrosine phosphatase